MLVLTRHMGHSYSLDLLRQRTVDLVAQDLRSESAVIARLCDPILEAVRTGHSHASIHQTITAGGLAISPTNYRIALGRARKSQRSRSAAGLAEPARAAGTSSIAERADTGQDVGAVTVTREETSRPAIRSKARSPEVSPDLSSGTSSATHVLDSLRRAQEVASKDYRRIAIDNYRQRLRNPASKDHS